MDKKLASHGFQEASTEIHSRLIMAIDGLPKQGKTHFSLSAPGDIALFNADFGLEGVVHKFAGNKKVYTYEYQIPPDMVEAKRLENKLMEAWKDAFASTSIRTVIADTATDIWELHRIANFGKLSPGGQDVQYKWGPVKAEYRRVFLNTAFKAENTNLILLHKMKKVYVDSQFTGKYERNGFDDMGYIIQVNARVWRDEDGDRDFHLYVEDCRQNAKMAGMDLFGPLCDFPTLATMVLPETSMGDWE